MYRIIKKMMDFLLSLILSPFVLIAIIVVGLWIKSEDGGTVFYSAKRIGKNGKIFDMYKFRSMKMNAPDIRLEDGSTYNSPDDSRITKVGKWIRKTSIDEIPQIINVLKGDMSFIGPRPDSAMYLPYYTEEERVILTILPGITGYNQALNRNAVGTKEKLKNDIIYVRKMSLTFDIKIVFMTIETVFLSKNIYRFN
jgi:lipopolysaccharide/colanic/teichoic acid biosynthesis glycosyltransferase